MTNKPKAKGTAYERLVVDHLKASGYPDAERRATAGAGDRGDIINGPAGWCLELKATKAQALGTAMSQARVEAVNGGNQYYAAIMKRHRSHVAESYVIMTLGQWLDIMKDTA